MQLCHFLTLEKNYKISHSVCPIKQEHSEFNGNRDARIVFKPQKISFYPFMIAGSVNDVEAVDRVTISETLEVSLDLFIVDDVENKPIFLTRLPGLNFLLFAEIFEGIREVFQLSSLELGSITPEVGSHDLVLRFNFLSGGKTSKFLMDLVILKTTIDALLFARGLHVKEAKIKIQINDRTWLEKFSKIANIIFNKT